MASSVRACMCIYSVSRLPPPVSSSMHNGYRCVQDAFVSTALQAAAGQVEAVMNLVVRR